MSLLLDALVVLLCYVAGAIPTGLLVARQWGKIDIREHGSRNIGATNVWRVLGWKPGLLTFLIDVAKAFAAVKFAPLLAQEAGLYLSIACGVAVLLGNFFNVFLGFKGGKGVATSLGVFLALAPAAIGICFVIFAVVFGITRYVSLGSICAAVALPILSWYFQREVPLLVMMIAISALVIFKHRANIVRLLNGTESRFGAKKTA